MTTSAPIKPSPPAAGGVNPLFVVFRVFAFVVLISMLATMIYSGWVALENWGAIRV